MADLLAYRNISYEPMYENRMSFVLKEASINEDNGCKNLKVSPKLPCSACMGLDYDSQSHDMRIYIKCKFCLLLLRFDTLCYGILNMDEQRLLKICG